MHSQSYVHPILLLTCTEGSIKGGLYVMHTESKWLSYTWYFLRGGWYTVRPTQYSLARSFTSGLTSNLASFPANKKQLAHSHTPLRIPSPSNQPPSPNSQATAGLLHIPAGKESREKEREIYWFPGSLISSSRLFLKSIFQLYEFSVWGPQLEATPNKLANPPQADAGWQVKKDYSKVSTMQRIYRELRWESLQHCQDTG